MTIAVPGYDEVLHPDYVVKDAGSPLLLVRKTSADFDVVPPPEPRHWHASPQARFERLLRETGVPSGLLVSPDAIRLVYAPKGESSGHITFKISEMAQVAGRPILAALHMLLSAERLFALAQDQRLPALLVASRKHQNVVSNKLSGQVMEALFDLLRGFQSAHDQTGVLTEVLRDDPNQVYAGLLTVLLRLVFILYAEDRDLLSSDETFVNSYSVGGLFERLRADQAHNPDTMDQRYGAWAQLVVLFRLIYKGARHGKLRIPGRKGYLFDPDRYSFLEGRPNAQSQEIEIPRVPDGVLYRVLTQLLILDGERLSYRNLDVEQIGSVYEAMMGFELHLAQGPSIALKPKKRHGAPITINLTELLAVANGKRNEWLNKEADQKVTGQAERAIKEAGSVDDLIAALDRRIAKNVTPTIVPEGAMIFQPSAERRRSGSHYTPRSLTQPIVEGALVPVLRNLGENPTPEQILALKVCDPAMGSGAFLVEACRQLGDVLVQAWHRHNDIPILPPDEDELLHARRLVAQQCLYGVDKNEMAVDLAKLSLWLATLARDHEFTFLDHSLRHGDSLVGYSAKQAAAFHWDPPAKETFILERVRRDIASVAEGRRRILDAQDGTPYAQLSQQLGKVEEKLKIARNLGDVLVSAFFGGKNARTRENARQVLLHDVDLAFGNKPAAEAGVRLDKIGADLRICSKPIIPFHWELEFPEVFALDRNLRRERGFDTIVGNPPFAGKNTLIEASPEDYIDWLKQLHPESHGNADLVAHFFRRAFNLLRVGGTFGLIATNTIAQGDTRSTGLRWICMNGGTIYRARKRYPWPGEAAVVVSVVHVAHRPLSGPYHLNGRSVERITAFLFHAGGNEDPHKLEENEDKSFQGAIVLGTGFTFDDTDTNGVASTFSEMHRLFEKEPRNRERIFPYLGGEDVNTSPTHAYHRYVINFEDFPLRRNESGHSWFDLTEETQRKQMRDGVVARDYPGPVAADWPDLLAIVEERVKPERDLQKREALRIRWWHYAEKRPGLNRAKVGLDRILVRSLTSTNFPTFTFLPSGMVYDQTLIVFISDRSALLASLASRIHEVWALFFGASMKDDPRYNVADCFETFPFPRNYEVNQVLEEAGRSYYEFRANLMAHRNEGLTKIYNRFHRPDENSPDIAELRRLHDQLDRAVLSAYGWHDLQPVPAFFLEFNEEDEEDEGRFGRVVQKKYRYRWAEEIHDEVLARLLALNLERASQQARPRDTIQASPPKAKVSRKPKESTESLLF
ncbi:MAG TPA: DNA methyltransferase [Acidobacteriaceae bacterium]|nr:DNA methyltransferase [Acidobacteriaceae bacterium]